VNGASAGQAIAEQVREAEQRRCRAVSARDWTTLAEILHESFVYHHWHGKTEDRDQWLAHLRDDYVSYRTQRESIRVDTYDGIAVVTGVLRNVIVRPGPAAQSTSVISAVQIWSRADDAWRERAHYSFKQPT
jgi:hypothetical protein